MKQMLFYVSQKAGCALELITISLRFVRSAFSVESNIGSTKTCLLVHDDSMF